MAVTETILFYLLIGAGVAGAILLSEERVGNRERSFRAATALLFWPLYLPLLLSNQNSLQDDSSPLAVTAADEQQASDDITVAIEQVESELDAALGSLDGWAENVLSDEHDSFAALRAAWHLQAGRIRELDRLLDRPEFSPIETQGEHAAASGDDPVGISSGSSPANDRCRRSERARQQNIERLRTLRERMHEDLLGTLSTVRELTTRIHLAKFSGAPPSRAEELVAQIAAAVEGLSEVTAWNDESLVQAH